MASFPATRFLRILWPPKPWPVMGIGIAVTLAGLVLAAFGGVPPGVRFICLLVGLITAGVAVSLRLKRAGQALEERLESAGLLAVAAFAALLAYLGTDKSWDSMQMALAALVIVALAGMVLVLLPTPARMIVVSVLVVIHFGGMITAANDTASPNAGPPWVAQCLHQYFYRPYLEFMYLNNAYHFYSPEPGPPSVVWFHVKYQDGQVKWIKVPNRDEDPVPLHHMRLLSIAENISACSAQSNTPENLVRLSKIRSWRDDAGQDPKNLAKDPRHPGYGIPRLPDDVMPAAAQYQEPTLSTQKLIESYVRHVASVFPTLGGPNNTVKSIKVYRFRHDVLSPVEMAADINPLDPTKLIQGYYEGEYDKDGKMLHPDIIDDRGNLVERQDPFLYWYMPIYYQPDRKLVDQLTKHAHLDLDKPPGEQIDDPNDTPWTDGAEKPQ